MRKSLILVAFVLFASQHLPGQILIQSTLPPTGLIQRSQLWNIILVNGTGAEIEGKLDLRLQDRQSGMELFAASSRNITLSKGSLALNETNLSPIQYNYTGTQIGGFNGLVPVGKYMVCYTFVRFNGENSEPMSEECFSFDAEPLSPPMLVYPSDSSVLENPPAQFSWTPPAPSGMFTQLRYELFIAEIDPGQAAGEALQDKLGFYSTSALPNNFLSYPASAPAFKRDKWYAWQVVAQDGNSYGGKSEMFVFKVKQPDIPEIEPEMTTYISLRSGTDNNGIISITSRKLNIRYYSFDKLHDTTIRILNNAGELIQETKKNIRYGDNLFSIPLNRHFIVGEVYTIEISDKKSNRHKAYFRIQ